MDRNLLIQRRQKLLQPCDDGSMVLLFANADKHHLFVQNNNFFYLTGLNIPEAVLMLVKERGNLQVTIFIERTVPEKVVWYGEKMSPQEVKEISGIEDVQYLDTLNGNVANILSSGIKHIYLEGFTGGIDENLNKPLYYAKKLREHYPCVSFYCLSNLTTPMRMIKSDIEIDYLKKAIDLTGKGLSKVFTETLIGKYEYQIEAEMYYLMMCEGIRNWGFKPIIASGKNATCLHYETNNKMIQKGEMLLLDVGALYSNYSADISRTVPAGKKYNKRQREVYSEVLQVQKAIINLLEPGVSFKYINEKTEEMIFESLKKLKLVKNRNEVSKYYMHSVSHFLGMDTHDVNKFGRSSILEPGNVITVEPGIYIPEEEIGVRIEDDVLITENGSEVLSADIPKEIEEIEALRSKS